MVKKIIMLLLLMVTIFSCTTKTAKEEKPKGAYLSFTIKNYDRNKIVLRKIADVTAIFSEDDLKLEKSDDATFSTSLNIAEPAYYKVARNFLYIKPGDSIVAKFDYDDSSTATYTGKGYNESSYLNDLPYPKAGSYLWAGRNIKSTIDSTITEIKTLAKKREKELANFKNLSPEFVKLEEARAKADLINSYESMLSYYTYMNRVKKEKIEEVNNQIRKATEAPLKELYKDFVDPAFLQLVTYQQIARRVVDNNIESPKKIEIKDWVASQLMAYKLKSLTSKKQIDSLYNADIAAISTKKYKDQLRKLYTEYTSYGNGSQATDFSAINLEDVKQKLSQFKGKLIYIDLWATWCMPCLEEMPNFNKLVDKYADNKDIVFISLSIDNGVDEWKENLKSREHKGLQWNTALTNLERYKMNGVPRIIIIDKDFNILEFNGPKPSSKETIEIIEANLKKNQ